MSNLTIVVKFDNFDIFNTFVSLIFLTFHFYNIDKCLQFWQFYIFWIILTFLTSLPSFFTMLKISYNLNIRIAKILWYTLFAKYARIWCTCMSLASWWRRIYQKRPQGNDRLRPPGSLSAGLWKPSKHMKTTLNL